MEEGKMTVNEHGFLGKDIKHYENKLEKNIKKYSIFMKKLTIFYIA